MERSACRIQTLLTSNGGDFLYKKTIFIKQTNMVLISLLSYLIRTGVCEVTRDKFEAVDATKIFFKCEQRMIIFSI